MKPYLRLFTCLVLILGLQACGDDAVVTSDASTADTGVTDVSVEDTGPVDPCDGKADGDSCDDGDPCTLDDVCSAGSCVGGSNDPCESDSTCQTGTCVAGEGCQYESVEDGTACSVTCFDVATCIEGDCKADAASAVVCATPEEAGKPCLDELQCDLETGECTVEIFKPEGTACDDDSNLCSQESCDAEGECVSTGDIETCSQQSGDFPCVKWACDSKDGECKDTGFIGEVSCDDGNDCTKNDTCSQDEFGISECVGEAIPVDDGNPCTDDSCKEGEFFHDFLQGASCDTGDACSPLGTCEGTNADDGYCKFDGCECNTDADCAQEGDLCAGQSYCDKTGDQPACKVDPDTVVVCPLGDKACHVNTCVPETGLCTSVPVDDGVLCDDGDACSVGDICQDGLCEVGKALECDDDLFCNGVESCDAVKGCTNGASPTLDDGIECTKDTCDEEADSVVHTPNDAVCDDGDACTGEESCSMEGCVAGEPVNVDDGNECTVDSCVDGKVVNEPSPDCGVVGYEAKPGDNLGASLASHGNLLAVGAPGEDSCDANLEIKGCEFSGAVIVYQIDNYEKEPVIKTVLKSPTPQQGLAFGTTVTMSKHWIAVGSYLESTCATGINPSLEDNPIGCTGSGVVYLYKKTDSGWAYHSLIKPPVMNPDVQGMFSLSMTIQESENAVASLVVGAPHPEVDAENTIIGGSGFADVYFYTHDPANNDSWDYGGALSNIDDPTIQALMLFGAGSSLLGWSLESNENYLAISAPFFQIPNSDTTPGLVIILSEGQASIIHPDAGTYNAPGGTWFGYSLSFYKDTAVLAVGAPYHSACDNYSGQIPNVAFDDNSWQCDKAGAVYLYGNVNAAQVVDMQNGIVADKGLLAEKIFKAPNTQPDALFGTSVAWLDVPIDEAPLGMLFVGAAGEPSCDSVMDGGIFGSPGSDTDCPDSGAGYMFWSPTVNGPLEDVVDDPTLGFVYEGWGYMNGGEAHGVSRFGAQATSFNNGSTSAVFVGAPSAKENQGLFMGGPLATTF